MTEAKPGIGLREAEMWRRWCWDEHAHIPSLEDDWDATASATRRG